MAIDNANFSFFFSGHTKPISMKNNKMSNLIVENNNKTKCTEMAEATKMTRETKGSFSRKSSFWIFDVINACKAARMLSMTHSHQVEKTAKRERDE